jgi:prepilin-type N-terminal cleavage/methylation domain-containing protein
MQRRDIKNPNAFTLIEMLVVVAIISLLGVMSSGYFIKAVKKARIEKAANNIVLASRYARILAIDYHKNVKLLFNASSGEFYIDSPTTAQHDDEDTAVKIGNSYNRHMNLPDGSEFEKIEITNLSQNDEMGNLDFESVTFYPDGSCDPGLVKIGNELSSYTLVFEQVLGCCKISNPLLLESKNDVIDLDLIED